MFSFALYDKKKNIVICSRDVSGEKPFYYYYNNKEFKFASELKALLVSNTIDRTLNKQSLSEFFKFGFLSSEDTLVKKINKIIPGQYLIFNLQDGSLLKREYFNARRKNFNNENANLDLDLGKITDLLDKSINQQMISDVPISILLSGGIDSSLITALASRNHKINTFTFASNDANHKTELNNSRIVAKKYSSNHTELLMPSCPETIFNDLMSFVDEPIFDSSMIPTFLISKEISKKYKVALSGDGGDELFCGYNHYARLLVLQCIKKKIPKKFLNLTVNLLINLSPIGFRGRNWLKMLNADLEKKYLEYSIFFDDIFLKKLLKKNIYDQIKNETLIEKESIDSDDLIYKSSLQDYENFLREDILVKTDRCSMANSLEIRCPFLDYDLINHMFDVGSKLKVSIKESKIILKRISKNILPKDYDYSSKLGFSVPIKRYFQQPGIKKIALDILLNKNSCFNEEFIKYLMNKNVFDHNNSERIFGLLLFELWRKKYSINF
jgi:asparagine synthase (glutamine-hydrolysing)